MVGNSTTNVGVGVLVALEFGSVVVASERRTPAHATLSRSFDTRKITFPKYTEPEFGAFSV